MIILNQFGILSHAKCSSVDRIIEWAIATDSSPFIVTIFTGF